MNPRILLRVLVLALCFCIGAPSAVVAADTKAAAAPKKAAAKKPAKAKLPPLPTLVWRGDHNTARGFMADFAKDFEKNREGHIELQPFSTISGLDAVYAGSADIAGSSRPAMLSRDEEKTTTFHAVAWDAVVLITSPKNPVGNITLKQIHDLYLGRLSDWSELGGPPGEINLYAVAGPHDGSEYTLRELIFHHGDQAVAVPRLYVNVVKLEEGIAIDPKGLGVSTLSGARSNPGLKILSVEGVAPSPASVADGSYPLYSTLFLVNRDDSAKRELIEKFIAYTTSESASAILRQHGLLPYADGQNLVAGQAQRTAFIDQHVYNTLPAVAVTSSETAATSSTIPNAGAPIATADQLRRDAPTSQAAQEAKYRAEQLKAEKAARKPEGEASHP